MPERSLSIANALAMTEERMASLPHDTVVWNMFASVRNQLCFMRDVIEAGRIPTLAEKNSLNLGVIAIREFETTDPGDCDAICEAVLLFKNL